MSQSGKARFIAIRVGQGDAFFIERTDKLALVDGGRSRVGFATQFKKVTGLEYVDILVCTHNDADHALGLLGFLECGFTAREVWLPASWTDRLDDLLLHPSEFLGELIGNIEESETKEMQLTNLGDSYSTNAPHRERDQEELNEVDAENLSLTFEAASERADVWDLLLSHLSTYLDWYRLFGPLWTDYRKNRLLIEALSAATLIREISLTAFHSGAVIRWFDYIGNYQRSSSGGARDFLVPINSEEIVRIRRPKRSVLEYLALTTANKESLVFMCPSKKGIPSILFTADSDLKFNQPIGWSHGMLMTAPHHGSESNAEAYDRFRKDTSNTIEDVVWVRSDGRFKSRPGSSYLQSSGRHYCTLCRESNQPKQNLRFIPRSNIWQSVCTRKCRCV
jgi:hypothetical protein